jgi:hypothetical protein
VKRALSLVAALCLCSTSALASVTVPADLGIGPEGVWFFGPLVANRGAVPHFALSFNLHAVIDRAWIQQNQHAIPASYRGMADRVNEVKIGPSIFIPSRLYISPPIDALGGTGMFGVSWTPIGLTLVSTGQKDTSAWNKSRGRLVIDSSLLLTYLFVFNTLGLEFVPPTHFFRPGLELKLTTIISVTKSFLISLGGGAQLYVPQRLGNWLEFGPLDQAMFVTAFAFLKFHVRFPYEANL